MIKKLLCLLFVDLIFGCSSNDIDNELPNYNDTSEYILDSDSVHNKLITTEWEGQYEIEEHVVYKRSEFLRPIFRIPSLVISNKGTLLLSCENRDRVSDTGEMDILVARKAFNDSKWTIRRVIQNNARNGRSMNPIFVIDRIGAHEKKGRIYLFASHEKDIDGISDNAKTEDADFVYKYSDDDGQTWSHEQSLKSLWDLSEYDVNFPSACNGIQLSDGTFLIPTMLLKNGCWRSGLLVKRPKENWHFSKPTLYDGDNECSVYIDIQNRVILDCRTTTYVHRKYEYNLEYDEWTSLTKEIKVNNNLKAEITRLEVPSTFFMTTYVDVDRDTREDLTLFASADGFNWFKVYKLQEGFNAFGYGSVAHYNNKTYIAFEDYQDNCIKLHCITNYIREIYNYISDK